MDSRIPCRLASCITLHCLDTILTTECTTCSHACVLLYNECVMVSGGLIVSFGLSSRPASPPGPSGTGRPHRACPAWKPQRWLRRISASLAGPWAVEIVQHSSMDMNMNMGTRMNTSNTRVRRDIAPETASSDAIMSGKYGERDLPDYTHRNFQERGFTIGIGGYASCPKNFSSFSNFSAPAQSDQARQPSHSHSAAVSGEATTSQ